MSYSIEIVRALDSGEHAPPYHMPERYETVEDAVRAADTEIEMIGVPGSVSYRILDNEGQPLPISGTSLG